MSKEQEKQDIRGGGGGGRGKGIITRKESGQWGGGAGVVRGEEEDLIVIVVLEDARKSSNAKASKSENTRVAHIVNVRCRPSSIGPTARWGRKAERKIKAKKEN